MAAAGLIGTSRVLYAESGVFRFIALMTVASSALAALAYFMASAPSPGASSAGAGAPPQQPAFATQSANPATAPVRLQAPVAASAGAAPPPGAATGAPLQGTDFNELMKH